MATVTREQFAGFHRRRLRMPACAVVVLASLVCTPELAAQVPWDWGIVDTEGKQGRIELINNCDEPRDIEAYFTVPASGNALLSHNDEDGHVEYSPEMGEVASSGERTFRISLTVSAKSTATVTLHLHSLADLPGPDSGDLALIEVEHAGTTRCLPRFEAWVIAGTYLPD